MRVWILQMAIIAGCAANTEGKNIQQNIDDLLKVDHTYLLSTIGPFFTCTDDLSCTKHSGTN